MIAGTTAYVYNNARCKRLARHVVEHMVSIMRLTAMISIPYTQPKVFSRYTSVYNPQQDVYDLVTINV